MPLSPLLSIKKNTSAPHGNSISKDILNSSIDLYVHCHLLVGIFSVFPSRSILHPALFLSRLICISCINRFPCPWASGWIQLMESRSGKWEGGREKSEVGGCVPWAPSFQECHTFAGILNGKSHFLSGGSPLSLCSSYLSFHLCLYVWCSDGSLLVLVPKKLHCPILASLYPAFLSTLY